MTYHKSYENLLCIYLLLKFSVQQNLSKLHISMIMSMRLFTTSNIISLGINI